jgi:hypothetical protein
MVEGGIIAAQKIAILPLIISVHQNPFKDIDM